MIKGLRQGMGCVGAPDLGGSRSSPLAMLELDSISFPGVDRETTLLLHHLVMMENCKTSGTSYPEGQMGNPFPRKDLSVQVF